MPLRSTNKSISPEGKTSAPVAGNLLDPQNIVQSLLLHLVGNRAERATGVPLTFFNTNSKKPRLSDPMDMIGDAVAAATGATSSLHPHVPSPAPSAPMSLTWPMPAPVSPTPVLAPALAPLLAPVLAELVPPVGAEERVDKLEQIASTAAAAAEAKGVKKRPSASPAAEASEVKKKPSASPAAVKTEKVIKKPAAAEKPAVVHVVVGGKKVRLGCSKCRGIHTGCTACRDPNFSGKRCQR